MKQAFLLIVFLSSIAGLTGQVCVSLDNYSLVSDNGDGTCTYDLKVIVDSGNGATGTATFSVGGNIVYTELNCTCNPTTVIFPVTVPCQSEIIVEVFYDAPGNGNDCTGDTGGVVLPVDWMNISGSTKDYVNLIRWDVAEEVDLQKYVVERANADHKFLPLDEVEPKESVDQIKNYTYLDRQPQNGFNYYRIKQVDNNGEFSYSDVISVFTNLDEEVIAYPNPFTNSISLNSEKDWIFYDSAGRIVLSGISDYIEVGDVESGVYYLKYREGESIGQLILVKN